MEKYYVAADVVRAPTIRETCEIGVQDAQIYAGRVKTIVEAESCAEAFDRGVPKIKGGLKDGLTAAGFGAMAVAAAAELGDTAIYERYPTIG